jgi:hypothetical protein
LVAAILIGAIGSAGADEARGIRDCFPSWRAVATAGMPRDIAAVAARSSRDVWAVGPRRFSDISQKLAVVHWDGRRLTVNYPFGFRAGVADLSAVIALSPNDAWAVGSHTGKALLAHWDGIRWQIVHIRALEGNTALAGITAISHTNMWAVGDRSAGLIDRPLSIHWDGRVWHVVNIRRRGEFYAVDGTSANDVWAVGDDASPAINDVDALAMHWNGHSWDTVATPAPDDSDLGYEADDRFDEVDAVTATDAWAVHSGDVSSDVQHWDGRAWSVVRRWRRTAINAIVADPREGVWAVGGSRHPMIVQRRARGWADATPLNLRRLRASLADIAATSSGELWAAGPRLLARYACR